MGIVIIPFGKRKLRAEGDQIARACLKTIETHGAFARITGIAFGWVDRSCGAKFGTQSAALTFLFQPAAKDGELAQQAQEPSQRTQIPAPETGGKQVKGNHT